MLVDCIASSIKKLCFIYIFDSAGDFVGIFVHYPTEFLLVVSFISLKFFLTGDCLNPVNDCFEVLEKLKSELHMLLFSSILSYLSLYNELGEESRTFMSEFSLKSFLVLSLSKPFISPFFWLIESVFFNWLKPLLEESCNSDCNPESNEIIEL